MESFRSSYRRLRLDADSTAPHNPYAEALKSYRHARESGLMILLIGGGMVALVIGAGLFWGGRLSVARGTEISESPVSQKTVPAFSEADLDAKAIEISQTNANLLAQLDESNHDRSHLQALLEQTRGEGERQIETLSSALEETRDLASIWVDHAQARLRLLRDRMHTLRDHRLVQLDPRLPQLFENPTPENEILLREYLGLQVLELESNELDTLEDLRRRCLKQVSESPLQRAALPELLRALREIFTRLAEVETRLEIGDQRARLLAEALNENDRSGLNDDARPETGASWFLPREAMEERVTQWIADEGPLHYLAAEAEQGASYRRLLREFRENRVSLAVPYEAGFLVVPTIDFTRWLNARRRAGGTSPERSLSANFREYYRFVHSLPHLRALDLYVSARENFESLEPRARQ